MTTNSLSLYPGASDPEPRSTFGRNRAFLLGLLAVAAAIMLYAGVQRFEAGDADLQEKPGVAQSAAEAGTSKSAPAQPQQSAAAEKRTEALAGFLANRYRVSRQMMLDLVSTAYAEGHRVGVEPLLILAVMAVESRFNPFAESVAGAQGLMQIIPRYHPEKFDAPHDPASVLDPETNIQAGARVLKEYIKKTGSLVAGLQLYNGAPRDPRKAYANKVLGEKQRLQQVVRRVGTEV